MTDVGALIIAAHRVVDPIVQIARWQGPLPHLRSAEFLTAPDVVKIAVLLVLGEAWILGDGLLDESHTQDFLGGRYHRPAALIPAFGELQRRRWPPTGDRDLWVKYGPDGPPADLSTTVRCAQHRAAGEAAA